MANKIFIGLIAFLVVVCGGLGYWSANLNGRINTLNDDTQAFKADTAGQFTTVKSNISSVDSSLNYFKTDTANKFNGVQSDISSLDSNLNAFKTDTSGKFTTVQNSITDLNTNVTGLDTSLNSLTAQYNESTLNVRRVYDNVIGGVCQIMGDIASGSGFIYSVQGQVANIVTCWHVVEGQSYLDVKLHDGRVARAKVVGSDYRSDVAVIKITGISNLTPLPLADSGALVAGEPVIVVGSPEGLFETVTYGVLSRTNYVDYFASVGGWLHANLIEYDAPSNHGNSGGPVFNKEGQVIGIVSWGLPDTNDMSCAVSSNKIKRVADAIIDHGYFTHSILPGSWSMWDMSPARAISMALDTCFGVWFEYANGVGGVQANDVAIAVDGMTIRDFGDLFSYIEEHKSPGDDLTLTVIRGGVTMEVHVELVEGWVG